MSKNLCFFAVFKKEEVFLMYIDMKISTNFIYIVVNDIRFRIVLISKYYLIVMNFFTLYYSIISYLKVYNDLIL